MTEDRYRWSVLASWGCVIALILITAYGYLYAFTALLDYIFSAVILIIGGWMVWDMHRIEMRRLNDD